MNTTRTETKRVQIDGSMGEGGGQVLRSSLSLSMITGRPIEITRIRAGRKKSGLLRQHLAAVRASAELCGAEVDGDRPGSEALTFRPGAIRAGDVHAAIGSAGSCNLVLQTLLPAMLQAPGPCELLVEGGTHNPLSPPVDFLQRVYLPLLRRMGAQLELELLRPGFMPAGGGALRLRSEPCRELKPLELKSRGAIRKRWARCVLADLDESIARREFKELQRHADLKDEDMKLEIFRDTPCPGNVLQMVIESDSNTELFTAFGELGVSSQQVARRLWKEVRRYLAEDVPVGTYLADQLMLPLALAGGGRFRTLKLSRHSLTQMELIPMFLPCHFRVEERKTGLMDVHVETTE